jgi:hypothetical protein
MMPRWFLPLLFAQIPLVASSEIIALGDNFFVDHTLVANQQAKEGSEASQPDPAGDDLILFQNGDLMHGTFGGIEEGLIWERADITRPIKFGLPGIKQVVFKSTRRLPLDQKTSFVTLASGDRIPGAIISLDDPVTSSAPSRQIPSPVNSTTLDPTRAMGGWPSGIERTKNSSKRKRKRPKRPKQKVTKQRKRKNHPLGSTPVPPSIVKAPSPSSCPMLISPMSVASASMSLGKEIST